MATTHNQIVDSVDDAVAEETEYVMKISCAKMPANCWGSYKNVAVMEVKKGTKPRMISERANGVVRVVRVFGPSNVGTTSRCGHQQDILAAKILIDELNAKTRR